MKKRILTGFTPTGKLHLGHYVGNLENLLKLKDEYETFLLLADTHALTTLSANHNVVRQHTLDNLLDLLSVGLSEDEVRKVLDHLESHDDVARIPEALSKPPRFLIKPGRGWREITERSAGSRAQAGNRE